MDIRLKGKLKIMIPEFQRRRDELIRQYNRVAHPSWLEYQQTLARGKSQFHRDKAYKALQAALKPHLEKLFAQIAGLKKQVE